MSRGPRLLVRVEKIVIDPRSKLPVVVLRVPERNELFFLWTGIFEANGIAVELDGVVAPRPMTHDLLKNAIQAMGGTVTQVGFTAFYDNTFFATVFIERGDRELAVDARPSDAVALALRCKAPVFVERAVLEQAGTFASLESWLRSRWEVEPEPEA